MAQPAKEAYVPDIDLSNSLRDAMHELQNLGAYLCLNYDNSTGRLAKLHDSWSLLTCINFFMDVFQRIETEEFLGSAYRYWLRTEESLILFRKFVNKVDKDSLGHELHAVQYFILRAFDKLNDLAIEMKRFAKDSANYQNDQETLDKIELKYQIENKSTNYSSKPNPWKLGGPKTMRDNFSNNYEIYEEFDTVYKNPLVSELEVEEKLLVESCQNLGVYVCSHAGLETECILGLLGYWSPLAFIKTLSLFLEHVKRGSNFWNILRSCDKLQAQRNFYNRFRETVYKLLKDEHQKTAIDAFGRFESSFAVVMRKFISICYVDSALMTENEKFGVGQGI